MQSLVTWHPVREKLPDDDTTILIADAEGTVCLGFLDGRDWRYDTAERVVCPITHWADMPDHPTLS